MNKSYKYTISPALVASLPDHADIDSFLHGPAHWARVARFARILAFMEGLSERQARCVEIFGWMHDLARYDDWVDSDHGVRGSDKFQLLYEELFPELSAKEASLISTSIKFHSHPMTAQQACTDGLIGSSPFSSQTTITVIGCCWDADRLDLARLGRSPIPALMSTSHWPAIVEYASGLSGLCPKIPTPG